jgi:exodeoxyribonuclease VII large subunit
MDSIQVSPESQAGAPKPLTVSQLAHLLRDTVRGNPLLARVLVRGEVSNLQAAPAGHVFFTLKDADSQLSCTLFREDAELLGFDLEDGMDVIASGDVDVFPRRGSVQLVVRAATPAGVGAFWAAYQRTRKKLAAEGLFDPARKRSLPPFPRTIGVVTSEIGAVVHDIVTILRRRFPSAHVILSPALVQGPGAPASLRRALAVVADRVDVVIVARGGGSLEDLWCFNDEGLARTVAASRVPVVSAIGHETDVTIVDFVADVRAATPSAAAELVSPDREKLEVQVEGAAEALLRQIRQVLQSAQERMRGFGERMSPRGLRRGIDENRTRLERMRAALRVAGPREMARHRDRLDGFGQRLDVLSPLATLRRGYAIAERADGHIVARAAEVDAGEALAVRFQDGRIQVLVEGEQEER